MNMVQQVEKRLLHYDKLPKSLDNKNKINRVRYLLDVLKKDGKIYNDAKSGGSCWKVK